MNDNTRLVYSTDGGRIKPIKEKLSRTKHPAPTDNIKKDPQDGIIRIHHQTKGRGGKGVCVITGFTQRNDELIELAKSLKQLCGSGGTVKENMIEIQGDHRDKLKLALEKKGYSVKLAGG